MIDNKMRELLEHRVSIEIYSSIDGSNKFMADLEPVNEESLLAERFKYAFTDETVSGLISQAVSFMNGLIAYEKGIYDTDGYRGVKIDSKDYQEFLCNIRNLS